MYLNIAVTESLPTLSMLNINIRCIIKNGSCSLCPIAIIFLHLKEFFNIYRILNIMLPNRLNTNVLI